MEFWATSITILSILAVLVLIIISIIFLNKQLIIIYGPFLSFAFSQHYISFANIEFYIRNYCPSVLCTIISKIYYHLRLYTQKHIIFSKQVNITPPDWSRLNLAPKQVKRIIFLRHSTSSFNFLKREQKNKSFLQRNISRFFRILQEIILLPTRSTLLLDPPLCERGIYQALKFNHFLSSFIAQQEQHNQQSLQQQLNDIHIRTHGTLDFQKLIKDLPQHLARHQHDIQTQSQRDIIALMNNIPPSVTPTSPLSPTPPQDISPPHHSSTLNQENQQQQQQPHHQQSKPSKTLLVSSSHRRALSTLAIALKHRLINSNEKIMIHSSLASFSPSSANTIPYLEGFDSCYISELIKKGDGKYDPYSLFDPTYNYGASPINEPGIESIISFTEFLAEREEDTIIIAGHSSWLLYFFRSYLGHHLSHVAKVQKLKNTCCIAFDLNIADIPRDYYDKIVIANKNKQQQQQQQLKQQQQQQQQPSDKPIDKQQPNVEKQLLDQLFLQTQQHIEQMSQESSKSSTTSHIEMKSVQWVNPNIQILYKGFDMQKYYQFQSANNQNNAINSTTATATATTTTTTTTPQQSSSSTILSPIATTTTTTTTSPPTTSTSTTVTDVLSSSPTLFKSLSVIPIPESSLSSPQPQQLTNQNDSFSSSSSLSPTQIVSPTSTMNSVLSPTSIASTIMPLVDSNSYNTNNDDQISKVIFNNTNSNNNHHDNVNHHQHEHSDDDSSDDEHHKSNGSQVVPLEGRKSRQRLNKMQHYNHYNSNINTHTLSSHHPHSNHHHYPIHQHPPHHQQHHHHHHQHHHRSLSINTMSEGFDFHSVTNYTMSIHSSEDSTMLDSPQLHPKAISIQHQPQLLSLSTQQQPSPLNQHRFLLKTNSLQMSSPYIESPSLSQPQLQLIDLHQSAITSQPPPKTKNITSTSILQYFTEPLSSSNDSNSDHDDIIANDINTKSTQSQSHPLDQSPLHINQHPSSYISSNPVKSNILLTKFDDIDDIDVVNENDGDNIEDDDDLGPKAPDKASIQSISSPKSHSIPLTPQPNSIHHKYHKTSSNTSPVIEHSTNNSISTPSTKSNIDIPSPILTPH